MSPRKLTEDDKQSMLKQYRNSKATTSTLAVEFGVSSSTVSRFLKSNLSTEEYDDLIQQKRLARTSKGDVSRKASTKSKIKTYQKAEITDSSVPQTSNSQKISNNTKKPAKRDTITKKVTIPCESEGNNSDQVEIFNLENLDQEVVEKLSVSKLEILEPQDPNTSSDDQSEDEEDEDFDVSSLAEMLGEEIEDDEDEDEEISDDDELEEKSYSQGVVEEINLEILPLASASLPRTCYLVIDRSSELIVKPLQEFSSLGSIPDAETQQKTLPVFDNHRIAKKFSHRREKVIKVPDGTMLQKTSAYLYNKGITRLLVKGKLYGIFQD